MPDLWGIPTLSEYHKLRKDDVKEYGETVERILLFTDQKKDGLMTNEEFVRLLFQLTSAKLLELAT